LIAGDDQRVEGAEFMGDKPGIVVRYWRLLRRPSTIAMGLVLAFGFFSGIVFWGGFNTTLDLTNTEQFCISCHEMKDNVYVEYTTSIHYSNRSGVRATCSDCHVPHEWTDKIVRKVEAIKDIWGTLTGKIDTREKFQAYRLTMAKREWARFRANDSLACRNCHDQSYFNFASQDHRSAYMHEHMLKQGSFTCIDCHKGIAHTIPETEGLDALSPAALVAEAEERRSAGNVRSWRSDR
jgi:cytochrome c-type protein NapC